VAQSKPRTAQENRLSKSAINANGGQHGPPFLFCLPQSAQESAITAKVVSVIATTFI
jgi:hypothetical protein